MSVNAGLIEQIQEFRSSVQQRTLGRDIVTFQLQDIDFDTTPTIDGAVLSGKALHTILSSLRVRDNFVGYKSKMSSEDWNTVKTKIREANGNLKFWGKRIQDSGAGRISTLFQSNPQKGVAREVGDISIDNYFGMLIDVLEDTSTVYKASNLYFSPDNEEVNIRLLDNDNTIDALNTGEDSWKKGYDIHFDLLQYSQAPFFERLVCTNGMVGQQYGWSANIQTRKFNIRRIQQEMEKLTSGGEIDFSAMLQYAAQHLQGNNCSIREFYEYRNFFNSRNKDHRYDLILGKFFNENELFRAYGLDPSKKSTKWQSTADCGRNAYGFLNDLTWIASHPKESRITKEDGRQLQITASNLMFKKELDLEDVAPRVLISVPSRMVALEDSL